MNDRHGDNIFKVLQLAEDQRAVSPWAGERHIEMVTAGLGLETARATGRRSAVTRDPVAELRLRPDEFSAVSLGLVGLSAPDTFDQRSHERSLLPVGHHYTPPTG